MGRYKRHHRTSTRVIDRPFGKLTVSMVETIPQKVAHPSPLTNQLIRSFFITLKKLKMFGDFINSYEGVKKFLEVSDRDNVYWVYGSRIMFKRKNVLLQGFQDYHPFLTDPRHLFDTILGRTSILYGLLNHCGRMDGSYHPSDLTELFLVDELSRRGKKVYPPNIVFQFFFSTIFSVIMLIVITLQLCIIFSTVAMYMVFSTLMLLIGLIFLLNVVNKN